MKGPFYLLGGTDLFAHGGMFMSKLGLDFNQVLSCWEENWAVELRLVAVAE